MNVAAPDEMVSGPLNDAEGGDEATTEDVLAALKAPRASMR